MTTLKEYIEVWDTFKSFAYEVKNEYFKGNHIKSDDDNDYKKIEMSKNGISFSTNNIFDSKLIECSSEHYKIEISNEFQETNLDAKSIRKHVAKRVTEEGLLEVTINLSNYSITWNPAMGTQRESWKTHLREWIENVTFPIEQFLNNNDHVLKIEVTGNDWKVVQIFELRKKSQNCIEERNYINIYWRGMYYYFRDDLIRKYIESLLTTYNYKNSIQPCEIYAIVYDYINAKEPTNIVFKYLYKRIVAVED
jgi:hypothetical protein